MEIFDQIAGRYGISAETLKDAWNKTRDENHENHVKKFKTYVAKLTGETHFNYDIPASTKMVSEDIVESIACELLVAELMLKEEEIEAANAAVVE